MSHFKLFVIWFDFIPFDSITFSYIFVLFMLFTFWVWEILYYFMTEHFTAIQISSRWRTLGESNSIPHAATRWPCSIWRWRATPCYSRRGSWKTGCLTYSLVIGWFLIFRWVSALSHFSNYPWLMLSPFGYVYYHYASSFIHKCFLLYTVIKWTPSNKVVHMFFCGISWVLVFRVLRPL